MARPLPESAACAAGSVLPRQVGHLDPLRPLREHDGHRAPPLDQGARVRVLAGDLPGRDLVVVAAGGLDPPQRQPLVGQHGWRPRPRDSPTTDGTVVTPLRTNRLNEV